jgi:hypothetical protein
MDLYGNIINWPVDFFGNDYEDLVLMNEAIIARKKNAK